MSPVRRRRFRAASKPLVGPAQAAAAKPERFLRAALLSTIALLPLGCTGAQPAAPDTAILRPGQFGAGADPDVTAVNLAQYAFADPSRTYGKPIDAARACAAMEYLAGQLNTSPRCGSVSELTKEQLLQGRAEIREALGVVPDASSQAVVDRLTAAANALAAADEPEAARQLGPPTFNAPGEQVVARLANMPYLRMANVSSMRAANELFQPSTNDITP